MSENNKSESETKKKLKELSDKEKLNLINRGELKIYGRSASGAVLICELTSEEKKKGSKYWQQQNVGLLQKWNKERSPKQEKSLSDADKTKLQRMIEYMNRINGANRSVDADKMTATLAQTYGTDAYDVAWYAINRPNDYAKMVGEKSMNSRTALEHVAHLDAKKYTAIKDKLLSESRNEQAKPAPRRTTKREQPAESQVQETPKMPEVKTYANQAKADLTNTLTPMPRTDYPNLNISQDPQEPELPLTKEQCATVRKMYREDPERFAALKEKYKALARNKDDLQSLHKAYYDEMTKVEVEAKMIKDVQKARKKAEKEAEKAQKRATKEARKTEKSYIKQQSNTVKINPVATMKKLKVNTLGN